MIVRRLGNNFGPLPHKLDEISLSLFQLSEMCAFIGILELLLGTSEIVLIPLIVIFLIKTN